MLVEKLLLVVVIFPKKGKKPSQFSKMHLGKKLRTQIKSALSKQFFIGDFPAFEQLLNKETKKKTNIYIQNYKNKSH